MTITSPRRIATFVLVGCAAAAVHLGIVMLLVEIGGARPLAANLAGWLVAMLVSFFGHRWLTFGDAVAGLRQSMRRFTLLSATGFAINQAAYAILLAGDAIAYDLALIIVLVGVAIGTYVAGRLWAFALR